jgi:hypothetical protein
MSGSISAKGRWKDAVAAELERDTPLKKGSD